MSRIRVGYTAGEAIGPEIFDFNRGFGNDGELTCTRKVRRAVIGDKFADLIAALYSDAPDIYTDTEVTYEDGRKGRITATLQIQDAEVAEVGEPKRTAAE